MLILEIEQIQEIKKISFSEDGLAFSWQVIPGYCVVFVVIVVIHVIFWECWQKNGGQQGDWGGAWNNRG